MQQIGWRPGRSGAPRRSRRDPECQAVSAVTARAPRGRLRNPRLRLTVHISIYVCLLRPQCTNTIMSHVTHAERGRPTETAGPELRGTEERGPRFF